MSIRCVRRTKYVILASVVLGCFFALTLAHALLYFLRRSYKANLWFMLFCATWFFREFAALLLAQNE